MNKLHDLSQITTLADFDLFSVPPTQLTIEKNIITEHRPISTLDPNSIIEFSVNTAIDEYLHLRETSLLMKIRIDIAKTATGDVDAADWAKIQPVNNLLQSLFKSVDLEIENKSITQSPQTYAYKAFFETLLGYSEESKEGYLSSSMWYQDYDKKGAVEATQAALIKPDPVDKTGKGKTIELYGKLHLDLAFQPRALLGGTKLKITLVPNDKEFYLWQSDDTITASVSFESAALYLTRSKLAYPVVEAQNLALTKASAKYPIMRGVVKSFTVPTGSLDTNIDNAILGQIPRRIFLALVDSRAFNGNKSYNPYKFEHFDLNYLTASVDGVQYPSLAYTPNFTTNQYIREYMSIYETLNQVTTDSCLALNKKDYKEGNVIYGFSLSPDPVDDCNKSGYVNPIKYGSIRISMKFANALTTNINVLIYCEYDNMVQIDATRQPYCDY